MQVNPTTAPMCAFNETDLGQEGSALLKLYQSADAFSRQVIIAVLEALVERNSTRLEALLQSHHLSAEQRGAIHQAIALMASQQEVKA